MRKLGILPGLLVLLLGASPGAAQEVYRNVSAKKLEAVLEKLKIANVRKAAANTEGTVYYYFKHDNFDVRLHNYGGRDLWIDCIFTDKLAPEQANRWNIRARMSRVVFIREGGSETVSFEAQIDCTGGITDAMIENFVVRFKRELVDFSKFMSK